MLSVSAETSPIVPTKANIRHPANSYATCSLYALYKQPPCIAASKAIPV